MGFHNATLSFHVNTERTYLSLSTGMCVCVFLVGPFFGVGWSILLRGNVGGWWWVDALFVWSAVGV